MTSSLDDDATCSAAEQMAVAIWPPVSVNLCKDVGILLREVLVEVGFTFELTQQSQSEMPVELFQVVVSSTASPLTAHLAFSSS